MELNVRTIAVVDDDEFVRDATVSLLRSVGLQPQSFDSAESFLELDLDGFNCVISDVQMPGLSGMQLQDILIERAPDLPIIMVTAFPTQDLRERAMKRGAAAFYGKPCDPDVLLRKLADIIGPFPFAID